MGVFKEKLSFRTTQFSQLSLYLRPLHNSLPEYNAVRLVRNIGTISKEWWPCFPPGLFNRNELSHFTFKNETSDQ